MGPTNSEFGIDVSHLIGSTSHTFKHSLLLNKVVSRFIYRLTFLAPLRVTLRSRMVATQGSRSGTARRGSATANGDASDRKDSERGPYITPVLQSSAQWIIDVIHNARFHGTENTLIMRAAVPFATGITWPKDDSSAGASAKSGRDYGTVIGQEIKDAEGLSEFEIEMLARTGGKWIYQANRQINRQESSQQSRS